MSNRNEVHESPRPAAERSEAEAREPQSEWLRSAAWVGVVMLVLVTAGVIANGCGKQSDPGATASQGMSSETHAQAASLEPAGAVPAAAALQPVASAEKPKAGVAGVPPDITLSASEMVVTPGEAIEITARGTEDVSEVTLWDGYNDRQGFVLDPNSNLWRVQYRVPLKPTFERLGVSVTAKNDAGQWRRVWVFLRTAGAPETAEAPAVVSEAEPDSSAGR
jgi:hypothetical protein